MDPYRSARALLPIVFEALPAPPQRIVDLGCGDGGWLLAAHELAPDAALLGLDLEGQIAQVPTATKDALKGTAGGWLQGAPLISMDLRSPALPSGNSPWRRTDLVICLEVAEHLPPDHAPTLVGLAASLASMPHAAILWSAAPPGQGPYASEGTSDPDGCWHHNEMPESYWLEAFAAHGFALHRDATTALRRPNNAVDPWYVANAAVLYRFHTPPSAGVR